MDARLKAMLLRFVSALCGVVLLAAVLLIEILFADIGWRSGIVMAFLALGAPCGMLLFFARSGRRSWLSALVVPVLAIVQSTSISIAVAAFPHSGHMHIAASIAVPWLVALAVYFGRRAARPNSIAA